MRISYQHMNITFPIGNTGFQVLNIIYEKFLNSIPSHSHGIHCYEIHYIPEGYGNAMIDGTLYRISPGTLYITGPQVEHAQFPDPVNPMCEYCVYIKELSRPTSPGISPVRLFTDTIFWFGMDTQQVHLTMKELFHELELHTEGYQVYVESLLKQLVIKCMRNYREKNSRQTSNTSTTIPYQAAVIIEDYFLYEYHHLSLEALSSKLGLSPRQTERVIKNQYGKTFLQKKTEARMSAAVVLLSDSTKSISSIAETLGYSSIEHFSSAFRKFYQISPNQYRKAQKYTKSE